MKLDDHVECAFITVDPDRDTPDVMGKYLKGEFFHAHAQSHTCSSKQCVTFCNSYTCMVSLVAIMMTLITINLGEN